MDANFARNMTRLRESAQMSQAEMVQKLRDEGWRNVHPTTISRIEKGERPVRLSEAARIAQVLGQDLPHMLMRPNRAGAEEELDKTIDRVVKAYNDVVESVWWLLLQRRRLRAQIDKFRTIVDHEGNSAMRKKLEDSEIYLTLRVDKAINTAREANANHRVDRRSAVSEYHGVSVDAYRPEFIDQADIDAPDA